MNEVFVTIPNFHELLNFYDSAAVAATTAAIYWEWIEYFKQYDDNNDDVAARGCMCMNVNVFWCKRCACLLKL